MMTMTGTTMTGMSDIFTGNGLYNLYGSAEIGTPYL